jgi:hypothetical protein
MECMYRRCKRNSKFSVISNEGRKFIEQTENKVWLILNELSQSVGEFMYMIWNKFSY